MGHVLIVDDDQPLRELLREMLEEEGYQVTEVAQGNAALELLRRSPHRFVVLLDYLMPGGDGKQVLQTVSRDVALSTRHAYVLVTARTRLSRPVLETANTLSVPVVRKPFDLEVLLQTVAEAQRRIGIKGLSGS
jgi:CheY-like chemotaxis protein